MPSRNRRSSHHRHRAYTNPYQELVNHLIDTVFEPEDQRLNRILQGILTECCKTHREAQAFIHKGERFSLLDVRHLKGMTNIPELPIQFVPDLENYLFQREAYAQHKRKVVHGLSVAALKCTCTQDLRDVLPDTLASMAEILRQLPREREEGFLLADKPMLHEQFKRSVNLLLDYQANRLIYA